MTSSMVSMRASKCDGPGAESPVSGRDGRQVVVLAAAIMLGLSNVRRLGYISAKLCCFPGGVKSLSREVPSVSGAFCPSPSALACYLGGL